MIRSNALLLSLTLLGGCRKQSQAPIEPEQVAAAGIPWLHDLGRAQTQAAELKRDLFIDISAQWCAPCQELEEVTFADPKMAEILREQYVPLNLDVTEQRDDDLVLMKTFGVTLLPALLVVRDEQILLTIREFVGPKELAAKLAELPQR